MLALQPNQHVEASPEFIPKIGMIVPAMGTTKASANDQPIGIANALFTPVQQRVLGFLFGQPERRFQGAELIRLANSGTGATHRVLQRLASCGLVRVDEVGRQKFYQANSAAPIYEELVALVRKTIGLREPLRNALMPFENDIVYAFVFGSVAAGEDRANSDIDLMVVAHSLDYTALFDALRTAEQALDRTVNPNIVSPAEWDRKRRLKDGFIARVAARPRLLLMGQDRRGSARGQRYDYEKADTVR